MLAALTVLVACSGPTRPADDPPPHLDYVLHSPYSRLVIETDYGTGQEPPEVVVSAVETALQDLLQKPDGVSVLVDAPMDAEARAWTLEELDALHLAELSLPLDDDARRIHVMFLDGSFAEESAEGGTLLGHSWGGDRLVVFREAIMELCESLSFSTDVEARRSAACRIAATEVWIHEVGHLIGLVDNGLPMTEEHRDEAHGQHDVDPECVMYWSTENELLMDKIRERLELEQSEVQWFCPQCQADVAAAQEL